MCQDSTEGCQKRTGGYQGCSSEFHLWCPLISLRSVLIDLINSDIRIVERLDFVLFH